MSDALVNLLGAVHGLEVAGIASTIREARRLLVELAPDLMVADLLLRDGSAIDLLLLARRERIATRVVILTGYRDAFAATEALAAGAQGYVLRSQPALEVVRAIETVSMGRKYVSPEIAARLAPGAAKSGGPVGLEKLSRREMEVLRMITDGHTSAEIARRLSISTKTIDTHRSNMYRKLALRNTVDLMRFATVHGIGIPAWRG